MRYKNDRIDYTDPTPWTWAEIAALDGEELARFFLAYGDRGELIRIIVCGAECHAFHCYGCTVGFKPKWMSLNEWSVMSCEDVARRYYARLCANGNVYPEVMP